MTGKPATSRHTSAMSLRERRRTLGWSARTFGYVVGCSGDTIAAIERGDRDSPSTRRHMEAALDDAEAGAPRDSPTVLRLVRKLAEEKNPASWQVGLRTLGISYDEMWHLVERERRPNYVAPAVREHPGA